MNTNDIKEASKAEDLLRSTAKNVTELASLATHQIEDSVNRGRARLKEMQTALSDRTLECARNTDQYVHSNPWTALGWAAALGLVIGMILRRK